MVPREKKALQYILPVLAKGNRSLRTGCRFFYSNRENENSEDGRDSQYGGSRREGKARGKKKQLDVSDIHTCISVMFSVLKFVQ